MHGTTSSAEARLSFAAASTESARAGKGKWQKH
jgi:hypothetical protein